MNKKIQFFNAPNKRKYREFYLNVIGAEPCPEIEVHHLDHNRDNNNIFNLVALPSELHKDYHSFFNESNNQLMVTFFGKESFLASPDEIERIYEKEKLETIYRSHSDDLEQNLDWLESARNDYYEFKKKVKPIQDRINKLKDFQHAIIIDMINAEIGYKIK